MEKHIKKLIIGFFAMMLLLTILSRAAASAMTAKVQVMSVKDGNLHYNISGTGTVNNNAKKYIDLKNGYKIGNVEVKSGQQVEKGDLLFHYDVDQLEDKKTELDKELQKLELQYEKAGLVEQASGSDMSLKEAMLAKLNEQEDAASAEKALEDEKNRIKKNKEEELIAATAEWKNTVSDKEAALKTAKREVTDAGDEISKLNESELTAQNRISKYKKAVEGGSELEISDAYNSIMDFYYNGSWNDHRQKVTDAQESLSRAEQDLKDVQYKWSTAINYWDQFSTVPDVYKAYKSQAISRDEEVKNAERTVSDAKKNLERLTQKDNEITALINDYRYAIQGIAPYNINVTYNDLLNKLYDPAEDEKSKIVAAELKEKRAREDLAELIAEWDKKIDDAFNKKEKIRIDLLNISDGSYDYGDSLADKQAAVQNAQRALKTAELELTKAEDGEQISESNEEKARQSLEIDLSLIKMDLVEKQAELDELQKLIENKGEVTSPAAGSILSMDLEPEMTLSGQEKLVIITGGYALAMTADKDDMKYFTAGDKLTIKAAVNNNNTITSAIENIELPDKDGKVKFTAVLPDGEYQVGETMDFTLAKNSDEYRTCVPIQALRQDSAATFILLAKETNTVLGKEYTAFRLDVTVLSQDAKSAAIEASISEEDAVIYGSNKNISEGDRVRIDQTE